MAILHAETGTNQEVTELRYQMFQQNQGHKDALSEIQKSLDELLKTQKTDIMRKQAEEEIMNKIQKIAQEKATAAACLNEHITPDLQAEFLASKQQVQELTRRLHELENHRVGDTWNAQGLVAVTFNVVATTSDGENIYLTGSVDALQNWYAETAVPLVPSSYPTWSATVNLPINTTIEYKYIRKYKGGVIWETNPNNWFMTPSSGSHALYNTFS